jgi:hypothetical protein
VIRVNTTNNSPRLLCCCPVILKEYFVGIKHKNSQLYYSIQRMSLNFIKIKFHCRQNLKTWCCYSSVDVVLTSCDSCGMLYQIKRQLISYCMKRMHRRWVISCWVMHWRKAALITSVSWPSFCRSDIHSIDGSLFYDTHVEVLHSMRCN